MSHYLNWKVVGYYDGKVLLLKEGLSCKDCVFLDMEIFRKDVKSVGQHMLQYNKKGKPSNWRNFTNCIQPNNLRDYDVLHDFRLKYPLATVHMLIGIIGTKLGIKLPDSAICPLFFTDGTFNVLFNYPENVLNWLKFLRADEQNNSLKSVFENQTYSVFTLMNAMDDFFRERDKLNAPNERGDRLRISSTDGKPYNILADGKNYKINDSAKNRIIKFIEYLAKLTLWNYDKTSWNWEELKLYKFTKGSLSENERLNNNIHSKIILRNPLSWAITSRQNVEYTLEMPDKLP